MVTSLSTAPQLSPPFHLQPLEQMHRPFFSFYWIWGSNFNNKYPWFTLCVGSFYCNPFDVTMKVHEVNFLTYSQKEFCVVGDIPNFSLNLSNVVRSVSHARKSVTSILDPRNLSCITSSMVMAPICIFNMSSNRPQYPLHAGKVKQSFWYQG